jgi:hypothetical protein
MATTTVQSRFDSKTQAALKRLTRSNGWTTSQALRECVLFVDEQKNAKPRPRLIGVGCYDSGISDLAANKKYMEGFGKKWRVGKNGKGKWDW